MEISKMLTVSTAHVPKDIALKLELLADLSRPEGWMLYVYEGNEWERLHPNVKAIKEIAVAQGCDWIMFDCDANTLEGISEYDWDEEEEQ